MLVQFCTLVFAATIATAAIAMPQKLPIAAGHWQGAMNRGASQLSVRFDLEEGPPSKGTFSAPDLGAIDIPLSSVKLDRTLHWELVGDSTTTTFDATVDADAMTGTFKEQNEPAGTMTLHRMLGLAAAPYATEPVAFTNGTVRLAGTPFVPR